MKTIKYVLVAIIISIICYVLIKLNLSTCPEIFIKHDPEYNESSYTLLDDEKNELKIIAHSGALNIGIIQFYSNSNLALDKQVEFFSCILDSVFDDFEKTNIHTLYIGRLISAFGEKNYQLSERLAFSAFRSDQWDSINGLSKNGDVNSFIIATFIESMINRELNKMFMDDHGLKLNLSRVEKVLIGKPDLMPFKEKLKEQGVHEFDMLPYDCLAWFKISPD